MLLFLLSILGYVVGSLFIYYGLWFTFITIVNVLIKGKYTPFVLILASILFSVGVSLFIMGVKL
jgi:hypothetical protein